ncbi:MAG: hemerythrin domain-containing protein [Candidatus Firestonebacteria bacterium]
MEKYLNGPIKEVITNFPKVGTILEQFNIGCVPCSVGSCLLKDVVHIHNLPIEQKTELMYLIEKSIYPDRKIRQPKIKAVSEKIENKEIKYSPPIKRLVDEHILIKKLLVLIPYMLKNLDIKTKSGEQLIINSVDFIRSYADKFHHAKEEDILFKYAVGNLDIINTMLEDHKTGRGYVKAIVEALTKKDKNAIIENLTKYKELLTQHIKKEDEILYPWIDRGLSVTQVGEVFSKFNEAEKKIGKEVSEKCKKFVEYLENGNTKSIVKGSRLLRRVTTKKGVR